MKNIKTKRTAIPSGSLLYILLLCTVLISSDGFSSPADSDKDLPVVSCSWLGENMTKSGLVVLHVSSIRMDYDNGHIPGAGFLWPGYVTISTEEESTVPAGIKDLTKVLQGLGVSTDSHIILCGINGNIVQVCRVFVTLEHIGFRGRVSILDGGFDEWKSSGRKISAERQVVKKGKISPLLQENIVDAAWMVKNLENKEFRIIDARTKAAYDGSTGTGRQGHIPGAKNLPATELYDSRTYSFLAVEKLMENFGKLEIAAGVKPVFYCNIGNMASVDYVAARIVGYDPVIYDGSMEEWGSRSDLTVEKNQ